MPVKRGPVTISGKPVVIVNTHRDFVDGLIDWLWRTFTTEGRDYDKWDRSLTDPVSGGRRGGVYQFPARQTRKRR